MKKSPSSLLSVLCSLLSVLCSSAATNRVITGNLLLSTGSPAITNILFTPLSTPLVNNTTNVVVSTPTNVLCDALGAFSVKLNPGDYYVTIGSASRDKFYISVPTGPGTYALTSLITNNITYTNRSNPVLEQLIHKDQPRGYPSLDALGQIPASELSNAVVIGGGITAAMATNISQGVLLGHLDPDDSSPLSGWQLITPYTTLASTNPATLQQHSFRIRSLGTNIISAEGDGGGDNEIWLDGNDGKSAVLSSLGNLSAAPSRFATNKYPLLRNLSANGTRSINLGGPSNLFLFFINSNLTVLKLDYGGRLIDLYGSTILDPTNHTASDGLYAWRGPLATKSIAITNIGTIHYEQDGDGNLTIPVPDGPGVTSYTITSPHVGVYSGIDDRIDKTNTFLLTSLPNPDSSGGGGDGWFRFSADSASQFLFDGYGRLFFTPDGSHTNATGLLQLVSAVPIGAVGAQLGVTVGGYSNTYVRLTAAGSPQLEVNSLGQLRDNMGNLLVDPTTGYFNGDAEYTWAGALFPERLIATGGTGTSNILTSPILKGNPVIDTNTALYTYGGISLIGHQTDANRSAFLTLFNSNSFFIFGHGAPIYSANQEQAWLFNFPATGSNNVARLGEATNIATLTARALIAASNLTHRAASGLEGEILLNHPAGGGLTTYEAAPGTFYFDTNNETLFMPNLLASAGVVGTLTVPVSGTLNLFQGTNYITFSNTNTPPVNPSTPVRWLSVQVTGLTNAYRLPLYQ